MNVVIAESHRFYFISAFDCFLRQFGIQQVIGNAGGGGVLIDAEFCRHIQFMAVGRQAAGVLSVLHVASPIFRSPL